MKKLILQIVVSSFLLVSLSASSLSAANLDPVLERLDLSGFLRIRAWNVLSKTKVPDKFVTRSTYRNVSFLDVFFRNRINLKIIPEVEIKTVFDISSKFGKSDFSLGNGSTNLITRDVYAILRPYGNAEIKLGLMPFSLPGGYILARDATGIQYKHSFLKKKLILQLDYIKAFDNADDSFGQGSDQPDYIWDDILIGMFTFKIGSGYSGKIYYAYEDDRYTSDAGTSGDRKKGSLHWIGSHNKFRLGNWFLHIGGIYNIGYMYIRDVNNMFRTIHVKAGLLEFETGYSFEDTPLQFSIIAEGATGDPDNEYAGISFQDIKASHGYSYIVVDNTGGLALRGSGESCWYGLYSGGLKIKYTVADSLDFKLAYSHYRTTKTLYWRNKPTSWYGDEVDLGIEYDYRNIVSVFITAGGFLPQRAYNSLENMNREWYDEMRSEYRTLMGLTADPLNDYRILLNEWDNDGSRSMIFEIMLGVTVSYD